MAKLNDLIVADTIAINSSNNSSSGIGCNSNISSEGGRVEELETTATEEEGEDEHFDKIKIINEPISKLVKKRIAYVETSLDDLSYSSSNSSSPSLEDEVSKIKGIFDFNF